MPANFRWVSKVFALLVASVLWWSCNLPCEALLSECGMAPETGPCFAAIPKFYFDAEVQECKTFTWGGCGGVVPFDTLEECQECECE